VSRTREEDARREWIRARILGDAWRAGFPSWTLSLLFERARRWFVDNRISFGIFMSRPIGERDDPIGLRVGFFTADSRARILVVGWTGLKRDDLLRLASEGRAVRVRVFGWLRIADDVDASLAAQALESVRVTGVSRVPNTVRAQLDERVA
jgi:hypothetical protein